MTEILELIRRFNFKELQFAGKNYHDFLDEIERACLQSVLKTTKGSVSGAASLLGLPNSTLVRKIEKFNLGKK